MLGAGVISINKKDGSGLFPAEQTANENNIVCNDESPVRLTELEIKKLYLDADEKYPDRMPGLQIRFDYSERLPGSRSSYCRIVSSGDKTSADEIYSESAEYFCKDHSK